MASCTLLVGFVRKWKTAGTGNDEDSDDDGDGHHNKHSLVRGSSVLIPRPVLRCIPCLRFTLFCIAVHLIVRGKCVAWPCATIVGFPISYQLISPVCFQPDLSPAFNLRTLVSPPIPHTSVDPFGSTHYARSQVEAEKCVLAQLRVYQRGRFP